MSIAHCRLLKIFVLFPLFTQAQRGWNSLSRVVFDGSPPYVLTKRRPTSGLVWQVVERKAKGANSLLLRSAQISHVFQYCISASEMEAWVPRTWIQYPESHLAVSETRRRSNGICAAKRSARGRHSCASLAQQTCRVNQPTGHWSTFE